MVCSPRKMARARGRYCLSSDAARPGTACEARREGGWKRRAAVVPGSKCLKAWDDMNAGWAAKAFSAGGVGAAPATGSSRAGGRKDRRFAGGSRRSLPGALRGVPAGKGSAARSRREGKTFPSLGVKCFP